VSAGGGATEPESEDGSAPVDLIGVKALCRGEWKSACWLRFVLPLEYARGSYARRCEAVHTFVFEERNSPLWRLEELPKDDLLPHVADYLNVADFGESTASVWKAEPNELMWLTGQKSGVAWELMLPGRKLGFRIEQAHLALFRLDLGFLILDVRPTDETASEWFDLQHYFRFFATRGRSIALTQTDAPPAGRTSPLFAPEAGGVALEPETAGGARQAHVNNHLPLINLLLSTARLGPVEPAAPLDEFGRGVRTVTGNLCVRELSAPGEMLTFSMLCLAGTSEDSDQYILARCVNRFHSRQVISPFEAAASTPELVPYGDRKWFYLSIEGSGFLATDSSNDHGDFWSRQLPSHVRGVYFWLFLLVTFQRFALNRLSSEVAESTLSRRDVDTFTAIHERVLELSGRGLFAQVARHRHHHRFYQALQRANEIEQLHQEVRDEVEALKEYATSVAQSQEKEREKRAVVHGRRLEYLLALLSVLAAFNLWSSKWPHLFSLSRPISLLVTLVVALIAAATVVAIVRRLRRGDGAVRSGSSDPN
jgi:hypothetical protein